jgi:hypothetical protein
VRVLVQCALRARFTILFLPDWISPGTRDAGAGQDEGEKTAVLNLLAASAGVRYNI